MSDAPLDDCYRVLELDPGASIRDVREAYRLLSRVWHPDRFAGNAELHARATARQQDLNAAYHRLVKAHRSARREASATVRGPAEHPATQARPLGDAGARRTESVESDGDGVQPSSAVVTNRWRTPALVAGVLALAVIAAAVAVIGSDRGTVRLNGEAVRATVFASGSGHACGADGRHVVCWTPVDPGAAGAGAPSLLPRQQLPADVVALGVGLLHACALLDDGSVHCWGSNFAGQLGTGGLEDRAQSARVAVDAAFRSITATGRHTCGLTTAGALYCWGDDTDGQLGLGRPVAGCRTGGVRFYCSDRPEPVAEATQWRAVSAGGGHTCAIDGDGMLHCWGSNRHGQLGVPAGESCSGPGGSSPCRRLPAPVDLPGGVALAVAAGASHTCALDGDGRAFCWGLNRQRQTGSGEGDIVLVPSLVETGLRFRELHAGGYHTCGVTTAGAVHCWGSDAHGELRGRGLDVCGAEACAHEPVLVATRAAYVGTGFGMTCVRGAGPAEPVSCWGDGGVRRSAADAAARAWSPGWDARVRERFGRTARRLDDALFRPLRRVL
jgi:hypothetical protein